MKTKMLLLAAALCWAATAFGQAPEVHESFFGHDSTSWNAYAAIPHVYQNYQLRQVGDTVIADTAYKKVEIYEVHWQAGDSVARDSSLDFFLREDTNFGRLWCRYPGENEEFLICDMSLAIGDSIALRYNIGTPETRMFYVKRNNVSFGRYAFELCDKVERKILIFIEGVGCMNLFDYSRKPSLYWMSSVRCCHKDGERIFITPSTDEEWAEDCVLRSTATPLKSQYIEWHQTLTFDVSQSYAILTATATSGLPVSYACYDTSIARISGDTLFLLRAGRAEVEAYQEGNDEYMSTEMDDGLRWLTVTDRTAGIARPGQPRCTLAPNPADGAVTVTVEGANLAAATVTVTDLAGKQMLHQAVAGPQFIIPDAQLAPGIYFVTLATPQGTSTQKLVVTD